MVEKPYQGIRTFLKLDTNLNPQHQIVVLGAGVDSGTTYRGGTRFGPSSIREASLMLTDGVCKASPVDIKPWVCDYGDIDITSGNTTKMLEQVENTIATILGYGKVPVVLGGEHTITLPILRAMHTRHSDLALIHLDAHCDTWSSNFDEPIGHGTWLYNAITEGLVDPKKTFSIGVRSPADRETRKWLTDQGGTTISARVAMHDIETIVIDIAKKIGNVPTYLTLDIDCLDPAYAPGTGTPEIGGLTSMWVLQFIENLYKINWVGMDCVEVSPPYDHSQITSLAAATFCWTWISGEVFKHTC